MYKNQEIQSLYSIINLISFNKRTKFIKEYNF